MSALTPLAFANLGPMEITLIFVVVLLIFGPKSLPALGRSMGQGIREFKKASSKFTEALDDIDKEEPAGAAKKPAARELPAEEPRREAPTGTVAATSGPIERNS